MWNVHSLFQDLNSGSVTMSYNGDTYITNVSNQIIYSPGQKYKTNFKNEEKDIFFK